MGNAARDRQDCTPQRQDYVAADYRQEYSTQGYGRHDYAAQDDELSQLPELRSRLQQKSVSSNQSCAPDLQYDKLSVTPSNYSEAESMARSAMSAWLGTDAGRGAWLSPI